MLLGGYVIKADTSSMPQKPASGFVKAFEGMVGASYEPIAYLGHKMVNGTNHAFLAKQTLVVAEDVKNIVLVVLNEKPGDKAAETFSVVEILPLISNGGALGGFSIEPTTNIPEEALAVFNRRVGTTFGAKNTPIALVATKSSVKGGAYVFCVESDRVVNPDAFSAGSKAINLVTVYGDFDCVDILEVIQGTDENKLQSSVEAVAPESPYNYSAKNGTLGYAFTWLTKQWP